MNGASAMFEPPVRPVEGGIEIDLPADERSLLERLLGELAEMLAAAADGGDGSTTLSPELAARLNPDAYSDAAQSAEYARLMSDELLASRLGAIDTVRASLSRSTARLDESGANAFMRSINTIRLVLGTMLEITDEDDEEAEEERLDDRPEYQLYTWLSWLLEWTVRSL